MSTSKSHFQEVLFCNVKAPTPQARILTIERYFLDEPEPRLMETLVIPEDPEAVVTKSKTDRFFLDLEASSGYQFKNRELYSGNKEWLRIDTFLRKSPLLDLRSLLKIFFPTLTATSLSEYKKAFLIPAEQVPAPVLARIIAIIRAKAVKLPGSARRLLKQILRAKSPQLGEWFDRLAHEQASVQYEVNQDYAVDLDRFENLTTGIELKMDDVRALFLGGSPLEKEIAGYEPRKGQARYSAAVSQCMSKNEIALLEAATGTGKSMGYLLPAIAKCRETESRVIIVTRTKSLQEQLFRSDLQKIKALIPSGMKIALLKGLANYLCLLKYKLFVSDLAKAADKLSAEFLAMLIVWEDDTQSGDLTETDIFDQPDAEALLERITLDDATCLGKDCSFYSECYGFRARKNAAKSSIVITNYALLFSDLRSDGSILGRFAHAIFDEAHRLEAEAISAMTESMPLLAFGRALDRVGGDRFAGTLSVILGKSEATSQMIETLQTVCSRLTPLLNSTARQTLPQLRSSGKSTGERIRFRVGDRLHQLLLESWESEGDQFEALKEALVPLQQLNAPTEDAAVWEGASEIKRNAGLLVNYIELFGAIARASDAGVIMWGQYYDSGEVVITVAPAVVSKALAEKVYPRYQSITMTSATLDSEDEFKWISSRLGLTAENEIKPVRLKIRSPFPLSEQLRIALARYLPTPASEQYTSRLSQLILKLRSSIRQPTLVLCTSYRMIESLAKPLAADRSHSSEVLIQTPDSIPQTLLNRFKQSPNPIMIGTESFWEGIDLPGELLRLLILTRLPFPVPDDPLEQAKCEEAESRNENPFMTVSLPAAILKFRQGIGRMIRNSEDWGAVVITDSRMGTKNYGRIFFDAAPSPVESYEYESLLVKETSKWLSQKQNLA